MLSFILYVSALEHFSLSLSFLLWYRCSEWRRLSPRQSFFLWPRPLSRRICTCVRRIRPQHDRCDRLLITQCYCGVTLDASLAVSSTFPTFHQRFFFCIYMSNPRVAVWLFFSPDPTCLISGFEPPGSDKVTDDEFDPIPVLVSKTSQGNKFKMPYFLLAQYCMSTWFVRSN